MVNVVMGDRRIVWTPCCNYPLVTRKEPGEIMKCTNCNKLFTDYHLKKHPQVI